MHPKDDLLRAYIDQELLESANQQVREHISHCTACQVRLDELQARSIRVQTGLNALAPTPREQAQPAQAAYQRFMHANHRSRSVNRKEQILTMFNRRPVWTVLTIVLILAVALSITPVRAWASDFLGLFRVQKVTVISFDPAAAEQSRENLTEQEAAIEALMDEVVINDGGEVEPVGSVEEAAAQAGFTPRIPALLSGASLAVQPASTAEYTINQPRLQTLIDGLGMDVQIPPSTDGQTVKVEVPPAVIATLGCPPVKSDEDLPEDCTGLVQLPSPAVSAPDELDLRAMGEAVLQFLGLPAEEAREMSQRIDWTTTLVLPIPQDEGITHQDVNVDGVTGTLVTAEEEEGAMLLWVKDGVMYALRAPDGADAALQIANSIP